MLEHKWHNLIKIVFLQLYWVYILSSSSKFIITANFFVALLIVLIDYFTIFPKLSYFRYLKFSVVIVLTGAMLDQILYHSHFIVFKNSPNSFSLQFIAIWLIFVPYYFIGLYKLINKKWLSSILGATFAPIAYYSGSRLGAVVIKDSAYLMISLLWSFFMPFSLFLMSRVLRWPQHSKEY